MLETNHIFAGKAPLRLNLIFGADWNFSFVCCQKIDVQEKLIQYFSNHNEHFE